MQQKQDIKGFTLLELIVVVTIIAVISASGYPAFTNWKKDREVRIAAENVSSMLTGIVSQTQRGSFPYVQFTFLATSNVDKTIFTKLFLILYIIFKSHYFWFEIVQILEKIGHLGPRLRFLGHVELGEWWSEYLKGTEL